jgi:alkyldihydroxyacetonephosphate synthase
MGLVASMRFTHAYPEGPAPHYTVLGAPPMAVANDPGLAAASMVAAWVAVQAAVSEVLVAEGATITHHHAVARDPASVMNPGALGDP